MTNAPSLSDAEIDEINDFLACVDSGAIPDAEALDGFFVALACTIDMVMPGEYMDFIHAGPTSDGDLVFDDMTEVQRFMELITQHSNHVNAKLEHSTRVLRSHPKSLISEDIFEPLLLPDTNCDVLGNNWATGFLQGTKLRQSQWEEIAHDEDNGRPMIPIWALAYENHPDPNMRPYTEPMSSERREELLAGLMASAIQLHRHFHERGQTELFIAKDTFTGSARKTSRNEPCPCGSGKKFKQCCGRQWWLN
jgi:uncharacterized protein